MPASNSFHDEERGVTLHRQFGIWLADRGRENPISMQEISDLMADLCARIRPFFPMPVYSGILQAVISKVEEQYTAGTVTMQRLGEEDAVPLQSYEQVAVEMRNDYMHSLQQAQTDDIIPDTIPDDWSRYMEGKP